MSRFDKFAVAFLVISCLRALAQDFQPVSPAELKMTSEPQAPGASAIILQRRVDRDDNSFFREDNYFRIKILSEEGRKYANVEIKFYKGLVKVINIRARTIKPDGSIVNFDGQVYEKALFKERWVSYTAETFTLPDVQVGSILEYSYTLDLRGWLFDSHWILSNELFTKNAQFSLMPYLRTTVPMSMRWTWKDLPAGSEPQQGLDHVIRMEVNNIPPFQEEDFMPPENELKARVDFIYQENFGESDPDKFWKDTGTRRYAALERFLGKPKAMEDAVRQIVSPTDPPEVKLRQIYARVQALRNTSYEIEKTEKELKRSKEKFAGTVADTWKRGYGTATELPWLLLGLARAAGLDAYGCWVSDRSEYFFNPKMMDGAGLRNNIVLAKLNGKDIYLDPGTAFAPFGSLPWNETSTPGLCLDSRGGTWIRTPLPDSTVSQIRHTAHFKLSPAGDLEGTLTVTYTGLLAMSNRAQTRHSDEIGRKRFLEELVKAEVPAPSDVELTKQPDWSSFEAPLTAEFAVKIRNWTSDAGRHTLIPVGIFSAEEKHAFDLSERIHPVYFGFPYAKLADITIDLPQRWKVTGVPAARTRKADDVSYKMMVAEDSGILHITRELAVDIFLLEKDRYPVLRNFFQAVRTGDDQPIVAQSDLANSIN